VGSTNAFLNFNIVSTNNHGGLKLTRKANGRTDPKRLRSILVWAIVLVASPLGIILWRTFTAHEPYWYPLVHITILLALSFATVFHPLLKSLRRFGFIVVIIFLMGYGGGWDWGLIPFIRSTSAWNMWASLAPSGLYDISLHLLRLAPTAIIITFLLLTGRKRQQFFLIRGNIRASVGKSRLIGAKKPKSWIKIATIFALVFAAVTTIFLIGNYGGRFESFTASWPLFPIVLLIAAMNAFNEEFTLRAAPLGELEPAVGRSNALAATTAYFGLGHYYGVPNGIMGVLLSGFLGWLLGKSMLETKGFFVAWLVHFITDIPIFLFFILGSA